MRKILIFMLTFWLMGCMSIPSKYAPPLLIPQPIESTDVIGLITADKASGATTPPLSVDEFRMLFEKSLREANVDRIRRNRIQDRLMLASNVMCDRYKSDLKHTQSGVNFRLGTAAVAAGALGAVSVGAQAAKNFSALAGGLTGIRAEFNEDYFSQLAAHVISRGITTRREKILSVIQKSRELDPDNYTLEAALGDAVTYHGACSLVAGLEQAESAVNKQTKDDPGLDALFASMAKAKLSTDHAVPAALPKTSEPATVPETR